SALSAQQGLGLGGAYGAASTASLNSSMSLGQREGRLDFDSLLASKSTKKVILTPDRLQKIETLDAKRTLGTTLHSKGKESGEVSLLGIDDVGSGSDMKVSRAPSIASEAMTTGS